MAKDPWTQNLTMGPKYLKCDCWCPGEFIHTCIEGFCEKIIIFWMNSILSHRALGPQIWPQGPNYLKYDYLGPGESKDTNIVGCGGKVAMFQFGANRPLDSKYLKDDCWGPSESIDTHILGFCERMANF